MPVATHVGKQHTHENRAALRAFLCSSQAVLSRGGQVHVTLKLSPPYDRWDIAGTVAEGTGMVLGDIMPFQAGAFPGYYHQTTKSDAKQLFRAKGQAQAAREARLCKTFVFVRGSTATSPLPQPRIASIEK